MHEWEKYQIRRVIYNQDDPRHVEAIEGITRLQQEFASQDFEIGTSDFGRLQLTLIVP